MDMQGVTMTVMFKHKPSKTATFCKVDFSRLNWKLRKLQDEGMYIVGVYIDSPKIEQINETVKHTLDEDTAKSVGIDGESLEVGPQEDGG